MLLYPLSASLLPFGAPLVASPFSLFVCGAFGVSQGETEPRGSSRGTHTRNGQRQGKKHREGEAKRAEQED
jgi:hypothetical protein